VIKYVVAVILGLGLVPGRLVNHDRQWQNCKDAYRCRQ